MDQKGVKGVTSPLLLPWEAEMALEHVGNPMEPPQCRLSVLSEGIHPQGEHLALTSNTFLFSSPSPGLILSTLKWHAIMEARLVCGVEDLCLYLIAEKNLKYFLNIVDTPFPIL